MTQPIPSDGFAPAAPQVFASAAAEAIVASDSRIVITGAGGWLGLATLELLAAVLGDTFTSRVQCFGSSARTLVLRDGTTIAQVPLGDLPALPSRPTILLHLAFLTKDRVEGMDAAAYTEANRALSILVRDALDAIGTTAVFVASSGAAYAADDSAADHALRLYGSLKRQDEAMFADWAAAHGRVAVITRIFNLAGPYINKHQAYALAAFINDALAGRAIRVLAPHRVVRGYVAIRELMSLVFLLLLDDDAGIVRFDSGGAPMELAEVAQAVAAALGRGSVDRAAIVADRIDRYVGDAGRYEALLARHGVPPIAFETQIRDTATWLVAAAPANG